MTNIEKLFTPIKIGTLTLPNRLIMAPLTRCRADPGTYVPNDLMKEYYTQRASAGLIITEFTTVSKDAVTFDTEGCIYNDEQAAGWKKVVDSVHEAGGKIYCQLAHGGRQAHSSNNNGKLPVSASPLGITEHKCQAEFNRTGEKVPFDIPRELTDEEAMDIVQDFAKAAKRAVVDAGFDGVEIHGANGYLIDQFLCEKTNKRDYGRYSGKTLETRCQFLIDIIDAMSKEIGSSDRIGLRISPLNSYGEMDRYGTENSVQEVEYISKICNEKNIAYLHVMRADFFGKQIGDVVTPARKVYKGTLLVNMGFDAEEGENCILKNEFDCVVFGTKFLANPDLPQRIKAGVELNPLRPAFFYTKDAEGYTDYPFMSA